MLTAAEQHLVKSLPAEKGGDLLKQVRTHLIETARPVMEAMLEEITGVEVLTLHHDISTVTRRGGCPLYPCRVAKPSRRQEEAVTAIRFALRGLTLRDGDSKRVRAYASRRAAWHRPFGTTNLRVHPAEKQKSRFRSTDQIHPENSQGESQKRYWNPGPTVFP